MKKNIVLSLVPAILLSVSAQAGVVQGAGLWKGEGAVFEAATGAEVGEFKIEMESLALNDHTLKSIGKVSLPGGKTEGFEQELTDAPNGFRMNSSQGSGGGYCFGDGLCQAYLERGAGKAFAISIVLDHPGSRRLMITELEQGRAVRFFREKLSLSK